MQILKDFLLLRINERKNNNSWRSLTQNFPSIDFCSNDYLGFSRSIQLKQEIDLRLKEYSGEPLGSTGSRLISGNSKFAEDLEKEIALFHGAEAGLLFNSGYDANLGLFSSIAQRGDTIIADELIHASIIDGVRLSGANRYTFRHNDLNSLEDKLKVAKGKIYVAVESIYSMDGDEAPLVEIVELAERFGAGVIVDEAHATGVFGRQGRGLVNKYNLQDRVFARLITFGKAMGLHGAIVLGSNVLRDYLINFARSFIYSTASPFHLLLSIKCSYQHLVRSNPQDELFKKIDYFKSCTETISSQIIDSKSAIQSVLVPGNFAARELAESLQQQGFHLKAILHPTVAEGKERIRICLHIYNTEQEIDALTEQLNKNL